jgi:hypothetical protein
MLHQIFNGVCDYKYEDILVRLNILTLHLRRRHLDALFLINVLKAKLVAHLFLILLVCAYPLGLLRDLSSFTEHSNFKVSPSARCVSAANAVCRSIDIINTDCIRLTDARQFS